MLIRILMKVMAFVFFCFMSSYVLLYGKKRSGIYVDYAVTAILILGVMWFG